jgi:hypothetical protein
VISSPAAARTSAAAVATLGLAAASWVLAIRQMDEMGRVAGLGSLAFFAGLWVSMMAAMMLPGVVPAVSNHALAGGRFRAVPVFIGSYLAVWALVGIAIHALYRVHGSVAAGVVVIAAGVYELTPLKQAFRRRGREGVFSGFPVRAVLRRLQHRPDGDACRARAHERRLDVADRSRRPGPEAPATEGGRRRRARDGRPRDPDRPRAVVGSGNHPADVRRSPSPRNNGAVLTTRRQQ